MSTKLVDIAKGSFVLYESGLFEIPDVRFIVEREFTFGFCKTVIQGNLYLADGRRLLDRINEALDLFPGMKEVQSENRVTTQFDSRDPNIAWGAEIRRIKGFAKQSENNLVKIYPELVHTPMAPPLTPVQTMRSLETSPKTLRQSPRRERDVLLRFETRATIPDNEICVLVMNEDSIEKMVLFMHGEVIDKDSKSLGPYANTNCYVLLMRKAEAFNNIKGVVESLDGQAFHKGIGQLEGYIEDSSLAERKISHKNTIRMQIDAISVLISIVSNRFGSETLVDRRVELLFCSAMANPKVEIHYLLDYYKARFKDGGTPKFKRAEAHRNGTFDTGSFHSHEDRKEMFPSVVDVDMRAIAFGPYNQLR